ncbi:MG2 domain-containing protein [Neorhodopirellula lusitana]|uniref:MG2 domain-containing protein n=1 Tax=Neorhodopirellula lusitana TaxID=445327 RepID=A0ABY1PYW9_9BACT|nr:MG2 domain-containing protein [Neorhodopirellula lusitana]
MNQSDDRYPYSAPLFLVAPPPLFRLDTMKIPSRNVCLLVSLLLPLVSLSVSLSQAKDPSPAVWKPVQTALDKGLPKSAVEEIDKLLPSAIAKEQHALVARAVATRATLDGAIQGRGELHRIVRLQADIETAPDAVQPVLHAMLANWMWGYFQQNQWRFQDRTEIDNEGGDAEDSAILPIRSEEDLATWSRQKIVAQSKLIFEKALQSDEVLKSASIEAYGDLLIGGNAPDDYRPTLFDFVIADAIDFYNDADQTYAGPADRFELRADSPVFSKVERFVEWDVPQTDPNSPLMRATQLYQDWLRFHRDRGNQSALLDADLARLAFAEEHVIGDEDGKRYLEALGQFAADHQADPISARAKFLIAQDAFSNDDPARAREIALATIASHPGSVGASQCQNLVDQIEAPSIAVSTERVWNPAAASGSQAQIHVAYKNLTKVYFRLVKLDAEEVQSSGRDAVQLTQQQRQALLSATPEHNWSESLDATDDYRGSEADLPAKMNLPRGGYYLLASNSPQFTDERNYTAVAEVWISGLSLVMQTDQQQGTLRGFVVNGDTGQPIEGANVRVYGSEWEARRRNGDVKKLASRETASDGSFEVAGRSLRNVTFYVTEGEDALLSNVHYIHQPNQKPQEVSRQSFFFTDRSIYRPGQTVRFKIIATRSNPETSLYEVAANQALTVQLRDANGKVVHTQKLKTNDNGSCNHSFPLPTSGLTGRMSLLVDGEFRGHASIRVEEYKRPKFEVALKSPKEAVRLNQDVTVEGVATAYTGAAIDGAKVSYTVTRETQMPPWFGWRCWWVPVPPSFPQVMETGTTETDAMGHFQVTFPAIPDESVDRKNEPVFRYVVKAEVTDTTGETREDSHVVTVGYAMLAATLSVQDPDWVTDESPVEIRVSTRTLQNQPASTKVKVQVHLLKSPERVGRPSLGGGRPIPYSTLGDDAAAKQVVDSDPNTWPIDKTVQVGDVTTDATGSGKLEAKLASGFYRVELSGVDSAGQSIQALLPLRVIDPDATTCDLKIASFLAMPKHTLEPGDTFRAVWGSGYETARAYIEISHRGKTIQRFWTPEDQTQFSIEQKVDESMRGGFHVRVFTVRENRLHIDQQMIQVPWSNKKLDVRWERFVSKLKPGQEETWTAVISGASDDQIAEMVATLYDASLDLFAPHRWMSQFNLFYRDHAYVSTNLQNTYEGLRLLSSLNRQITPARSLSYRDYPRELQSNIRFGFGRRMQKNARGMMRTDSMMMEAAPAPMMAAGAPLRASSVAADEVSYLMDADQDSADLADAGDGEPPAGNQEVDLSDVSPRRNLNETAFFLPELTADEDGVVSMKFTMPEALTRWQLIGFAHTNDLSAGEIRDTVVTSKDLMVQPNPPRVLREGDQIEMTVKVSNQSATNQTGTVALQFSDARTGDSVDVDLENTSVRQSFDIPAGQSKSFSWPIRVPDGMGFLTYKAVGSTGRLSDGEEGYLPVLSRRILVHESLALPIDGAETKTFTLDKLATADGKSITNESLTVQMTSNPAWYAVMALPYLMEYPHECSEQTFNRLYANLLARHIATSDPKIERVFEQWRRQPVAAGRETLDSPLEQNQDIASIALTETPWVLEAESESEARRNVGNLFDTNRTNDQVARWTERLAEMQLDDGSWPWFDGGRSNSFITLYLTTGFGRLRHLGVDVDTRSAIRSLQHLDQFVLKQYKRIKDSKQNHLSSTIALYLYGRSFFLEDMPISAEARVAVDYYLGQAQEHWLSLSSRMSQAHLAVALKRFGRLDDALAITASLKERSANDDQGMHWNDGVDGWFWHQADIESQAMMIEAFDEVAGDQASVESCKAWLLRQKETRSWETTKGTADAIYALLLRGVDLLADQTLVDVKVGQSEIEQDDVEAGTGFYQQRFTAQEITPAMSSITVTKTTPGIAWGGVHWTFFQNIDEITPHEGTPLKIEKQLFVVRSTPTGEVMQPIVDGQSKQPVEVGDQIVSRLIVRTDRAMEFIHLKDSRGSGTEPANVLSQYQFQDGVGYYHSTRDAAEHFFIDYLPAGTFVIESRSRVQLRGEYQSGLATIESMYAPKYNSHSESHPLKIGG